MDYQPLLRKIKQIAKKAGINKKVHPHILRHTRTSILANYLMEAQMCEYFGWVQGSDMPTCQGEDLTRDIVELLLYMLLEEEVQRMMEECCERRLKWV